MHREERELIILVGMQGAGKTFYCQTVLPDYERISQDDGPRTYRGVLLRLDSLLRAGVPRIVIDRTNPLRCQRQEFATLARAAGYRLKMVYFDTPVEVCRERIRARKGHPTLAQNRMNEAIEQYSSKLNMPTPGECDELVIVGRDSHV